MLIDTGVAGRLLGASARAADLRRRGVARTPLERLVGAAATVAVTGGRHPSSAVAPASFPTADGAELPLLVIRPRHVDGVLPAVVAFHGGGWAAGDEGLGQPWLSRLAVRAGVVVVSVGYRLAPEHPFPTPPEDCWGAARWVADHAAELDVDADRIAVLGESAGGNLAAAVAVMARDRSGPALALQVLLNPHCDLLTRYPSQALRAHGPLLTSHAIEEGTARYLAGADPAHPYASPALAGLRGVAPALVQTAGLDPLRDDGAAYAGALRRSGVGVRYSEYRRAVHGYASFPRLLPTSRKALAEVVHTVRTTLHQGRNFS